METTLSIKRPQQQGVAFPTDEAGATILNGLKTHYDTAAAWTVQQSDLAAQCQKDVEKWLQEIRERQAWIEQRELAGRQAQQESQRGRDVAKGIADLLAHLGAPIPPPNGELSHDPDGSLGRFNAATDEQRSAEGAR